MMATNPSTIFYDADCPFCRREIAWLMRRDRDGRLATVDIASPEFDPAGWGVTREDVAATFHVATGDGRVLDGVAAFRHVYGAVGLGWLLAPTGWPVLRPIFDVLYRIFARFRVPLGNLVGRRCAGGTCATPPSRSDTPAS